MRYLYPRFTRLSLKTSNVSVSSLCVHDSGKWVHVVHFAFLPSQVTSKVEDEVCLPVVRAHMLPYQVQGVCNSLSINVTGQLSVLIPYLFQAMVCHPTASDGCWVIHSFIVAISISADLFRTVIRNVSLHPSCTSPNTQSFYTVLCITFPLLHLPSSVSADLPSPHIFSD